MLTGLNDSSILTMSIPDCNFSRLFKDNYVQCVRCFNVGLYSLY